MLSTQCCSDVAENQKAGKESRGRAAPTASIFEGCNFDVAAAKSSASSHLGGCLENFGDDDSNGVLVIDVAIGPFGIGPACVGWDPTLVELGSSNRASDEN